MIVIHSKVLERDIPTCLKKNWYPGIEVEFKRILKLLNIDKKLPGQYPIRGLKGLITIQHARINLPKNNSGKSSGPRIVYWVSDVADESSGDSVIRILYIGGHKDKKYNDDEKIVNEVVKRFADESDRYIPYDAYLTGVNLESKDFVVTQVLAVEREEIEIDGSE